MINERLLLILTVFLYALSIQQVLGQSNKSFSFALPDSETTSAGVYTDNHILIRTLWSGKRYPKGTHTEQWDGKLDNDSIAPQRNYHVEVLSNKVVYEPEGARIGNSSTALFGLTLHNGAGDPPLSLATTGNYLYYAGGYREKTESFYRTSLNNIGSVSRVFENIQYTGGAPTAVCTDGTYVYWGAYDEGGDHQSFVFATKVSDNTLKVFQYGSAVVGGTPELVPSVIGKKDYGSDLSQIFIRNLAVQANGNKLFIPRLNHIDVYDKNTGQELQNITVSGYPVLAVDANDNLWVGTGNSIVKYIVNSNGSITSTGLTLNSILYAGAIAVTTDNSTVIVADSDQSQQVVKGFNNATGGNSLWTLGVPGGYMDDATVSNNKFYFSDLRTKYPFGIACQSDGSFWISDGNNSRIQHYSASRTFIERIQYGGGALSVHVDPAHPSRLFAKYVEYSVDPSKPLDNGFNGSWTLAKNWGGRLPANDYNDFPGTQSFFIVDGHTFARLERNNSGGYDYFELVEGGTLRKTKVHFDHPRATVGKNGDKYIASEGAAIGLQSHIYKYAYTGLDSDNDPTWSTTAQLVIETPVLTPQNHLITEGIFHENITSTGKWIFFDADKNSIGNGTDPHLSAIPVGGGNYQFQTSYGTQLTEAFAYDGDFPINYFDNGNGVMYAGGFSDVAGSLILWSYHGEFWKQGQTNKFNLFWENGLFIGQFGLDALDMFGKNGELGGGGSCLGGSLVPYSKDITYLYQGDDGGNAGIARWKISGLSTVYVQTVNFDSSLILVPPPGKNLMSDLTSKGYLSANTGGWTISQPGDNSITPGLWIAYVGVKTPSFRGTQDLYALYSQSVPQQVTCVLGNNVALPSWKLSGDITFDRNTPNQSGTGGCHLEVLDSSGKVIASLSNDFPSMGGASDIVGNNIIIRNFDVYEEASIKSRFQHFEISVNNNTITFKYAGSSSSTTTVKETGANVQTPATLRLNFLPGSSTRAIGVRDLVFESKNLYFRSKKSGSWSNISTWQSSSDSSVWTDAYKVPTNLDYTITIQPAHSIIINDTVTVDQLFIQNGANLAVSPMSTLVVTDGPGHDLTVASGGTLLIQSDSTGTGRIGNSTGTITGDVTVERYISSKNNQAYRFLSPTVNTAGSSKPFIRDNWQEGQYNVNMISNSNTVPHYGMHVTGSMIGANGFDATVTGEPSVFTFDQIAANQQWVAIPNTNATNLDATKGYRTYIRGDRSVDLKTIYSTENTTLRTTGKLLTGTQNFTNLEGNGRLSLIANPYASAINWRSIYSDPTTNHTRDFENYFYYYDPNIGTNGGYVSVNAQGIKSTTSEQSLNIPIGAAFFVRAKEGIWTPMLTVRESHKSSVNADNFRKYSPAQLMTSLYFVNANGVQTKADGTNAVFDDLYSGAVDENDAEDLGNQEENIAIFKYNKMLSIEARPSIQASDTLALIAQRLKPKSYQWRFNATGFNAVNLQGHLVDKYLNTNTPISLSDTTTVQFMVTVDPATSAPDRFYVIFTPYKAFPTLLTSVKAYHKANGTHVEWTVKQENGIARYEVEKSLNGLQFTKAASIKAKSTGITYSDYNWLDTSSMPGNNYYRIKINNLSGKIDYSNLVNVVIGDQKRDFDVYPNPVKGNNFIIQFKNVPKGIYTISLINLYGVIIDSREIIHVGGSAGQTYNVNNSFLPGPYTVQLTGNGIYLNKSILK